MESNGFSPNDLARALHDPLSYLPLLIALIFYGLYQFVAAFSKETGEAAAKGLRRLVSRGFKTKNISPKISPTRVRTLAYRVALVNMSTVLTDGEVNAAMSALRTQVNRDFAPIWGVDAELTFAHTGSEPPKESWQLIMLDDSDQAGALSYHDFTDDGLPMAKVFVAAARQWNIPWTHLASHELLNMLVNPRINLMVLTESKAGLPILYSYEVTAPCSSAMHGYQIDGALVSDFVTSAWFENWRKPHSTKFDFAGHMTKPFELLPGGHAYTYRVKSGKWQQPTAKSSNGLFSQSRTHFRPPR
jgi:hypothetical protein